MVDIALLEFIKANAKRLFGNQFWEARFLYAVDVGPKLEKLERRILVLSKFRLFFISGKTSAKLHVETSYPLLSLTEITLPANNKELSIVLDGRRLLLRLTDDNSTAHDLAIQLLTAFKHYYENCDLHRFVELSPISLYSAYSQLPSARLSLPCGGFRRTYASLCDFHKQTFRDEIVWDIEKIYSLHSNTVLRLDDFSHLSSKDLIPLIATLQFSSWFCGVLSDNMKLTSDLTDAIIHVLRRSQRIKSLCLRNSGLKCDFLQSLSHAMSTNTTLPLESLDLTGNTFDDSKTVAQFSHSLSSLVCDLRTLHLEDCCLSTKSVNYLCERLKDRITSRNESGAFALKSLCLAGNPLKEECGDLNALLCHCPFLTHLNLSGTGMLLDKLWHPLKSSCKRIECLKLAGCVFTTRKSAKDLGLLTSIKEFFSSSQSLTCVDLSDCALPAEVLKYILLGLVCNQRCDEVSLDLSRSFADRQCISHLETCAPDLTAVTQLSLRDCALENDAVTLIPSLALMKRLKGLDLGGNNFSSSKKQHTKNLRNIMMEMIKLIGEENPTLQELTLSDCRIGAGVCVLLNALGVASSLKILDISGNDIGNFGARLLGKALQVNSSLEILRLDRNQITWEGYADVVHALKYNNSLLSMPNPIQDVSESLKLNKEKTESILNELESLLRRNNRNQGFSECVEASSWVYETHSKLILGNVEEELNQVASKTNRLLAECTYDSESSEVVQARKLLRDAEVAKEMIDKLVSLGDSGECITTHIVESIGKVLGEKVRHNLSEAASSMTSYCTAQNFSIYQNSEIHNALKTACNQRLSDLNVELAAQEFARVLRQRYTSVQFNMAANISERICQELAKALNCVNNLLVKFKKSSLSNSISGDRPSSTSTGSGTPSGKKRFKLFNKRPLSVIGNDDGTGVSNLADLADDHSSDDFRAERPLDDSTDNFDCNSIEFISKDDLNFSTDDSGQLNDSVTPPKTLLHVQKDRAKPPPNRKARAGNKRLQTSTALSSWQQQQTVDEGVDKFFDQIDGKLEVRSSEPSPSNLRKMAPEKAGNEKRTALLPISVLTTQQIDLNNVAEKRTSKLLPGIPLLLPGVLNELGAKVLPSFHSSGSCSTPSDIALRQDDQAPAAQSQLQPSPAAVASSSSIGADLMTDFLSLIDTKFGDNHSSKPMTSSVKREMTSSPPEMTASPPAMTSSPPKMTSSSPKMTSSSRGPENRGQYDAARPAFFAAQATPLSVSPIQSDATPSSSSIRFTSTPNNASEKYNVGGQSLVSSLDQDRARATLVDDVPPPTKIYREMPSLGEKPAGIKSIVRRSSLNAQKFQNDNDIENVMQPAELDQTFRDEIERTIESAKAEQRPPLPNRPPPARPSNRSWEANKSKEESSHRILLREKSESPTTASSNSTQDQRKSVFEMRRVFESSKESTGAESSVQAVLEKPPVPPPRQRINKSSHLSQ